MAVPKQSIASTEPELIQGGLHTDDRGQLLHINAFDMTKVKRFYQVRNVSTKIVRAWQGHRHETKFFFVGHGAFKIALVKVDNWDQPDKTATVQVFRLSADNPQVLAVPGGYANGVQSLTEDAILTIFSDFDLEQSAADTVRFAAQTWNF